MFPEGPLFRTVVPYARPPRPGERNATSLHRVSYRVPTPSTNAIESLNSRFRRAVKARGHFPNEHAALKCLYLTIRSLDPTGRGKQRWTNRWKKALNAFEIAFEGRIITNRN